MFSLAILRAPYNPDVSQDCFIYDEADASHIRVYWSAALQRYDDRYGELRAKKSTVNFERGTYDKAKGSE